MPFVAAPNVVMVEFRATRNLQNVENRVMVDMLAVPIAADMTDLAVACWNWWENVYAEHLHVSCGLREVVVTSQHVADGPQVTYAPDTTTVGDLTGAALPNECSFCVSLRTGNRGRSARGRFYTLSVTQAQMEDDNNLTAAAADDFATDLNQLMAAITGEARLPVIVSYRTGGAPRVGGPVYFPITNCTVVDAVVDSMKRRKPGVGS